MISRHGMRQTICTAAVFAISFIFYLKSFELNRYA
jgi:hypothetical protein